MAEDIRLSGPYATLDSTGKVPRSQLGATPDESDTTKFLRDDGSWAAPTSAAPSGAAGGSLDGTYPNPGIASSVAGDGLAETSNVLSVNVDGSTIETSSDALRVKALGITDSHVAAANKDGAAGTASMRTLSTTSTTACAGNDSRLSNSRTPTAHATTHNAGGSDVMEIDAAAGTGSLRTLGTGATQAAVGNAVVQKTGDTMTGLLTVGSGDAQSVYNATSAQLFGVIKGTSASPDTTTNPLVKVTRLIEVAEASVTGDGVENLSSVLGVCVGTALCETQPVGTAGLAKTSSTAAGGTAGGNDACGVYGVGKITGSGTGGGIGGFFNGRRDTDTGHTTGIEVSSDNNTATAASYGVTGKSNCTGIWLHGTGSSRSGCGLEFGNPFSVQFDVGIGFLSQNSGAVLTNSIRDDSTSTTAILINGTHSTAALAVASGSGKVLIGAVAENNTETRLEVRQAASTLNPLIFIGQTASAWSTTIELRNLSGQHRMFIGAGANTVFTGSAAGDAGWYILTSGKKYMIGGVSGQVPGITVESVTAAAPKIGFFTATTVIQQAGTGEATGFTAGVSTPVLVDSTFTGNVGSTAYRINDVVKALKNYGLLAA